MMYADEFLGRVSRRLQSKIEATARVIQCSDELFRKADPSRREFGLRVLDSDLRDLTAARDVVSSVRSALG